jgi:hypothetical protein
MSDDRLARPAHVRWFWIGWHDGRAGRPVDPPRTQGRRCAREYRNGHEDGAASVTR